MKIRKGFVSNSSSSSFIIASDKEPGDLELKVELKCKADKITNGVIRTEEELISFCKKELCWNDNGFKTEEFENMLNSIRKGKKLICCQVGNEEENPLETILFEEGIDNLILSENSKIVHEES